MAARKISEESIREAFAANLRYRLRERELTQAEFGRRLGVLQSQVAHWVTGRAMPSTRSLVEICNNLEVTPGYLLKDRYQEYTNFAM